MISVIICSVNPEHLKELSWNIEATVGLPYELLAFDNRIENNGISKVYNDAAAKSKYNILCFIHEDIKFHTKNWGQVLVNVLKDKKNGLVGVSGAVYKSKYPGTWSACDSSFYRTHSIQHYKNTPKPIIHEFNPEQEDVSEVAVIDGVFMAITKKIFYQFHFDQKSFPSFHGYDLDYSLQISTRYKVVITHQILLEHFSEGNLNGTWIENSLKLHEKWKNTLPVSLVCLTKSQKKLNDYLALCCALNVALQSKKYKKKVIEYYLKMILKFYSINKLKYSKTVFKYLLLK